MFIDRHDASCQRCVRSIRWKKLKFADLSNFEQVSRSSSGNKTRLAIILASVLKIHGIKKSIAVQRFQRRNETHGQTTKHTHNTRNTKKVSKRKKTHHTQHNIQHKTKHNKIKNNETK